MAKLALRGPELYDEQTGEVLIILDGSTSQTHELRADLTDHPVEDGSNISDHVRLQPISVTVEAIISATPIVDEWKEGREIDAWWTLSSAVGTNRLFTLYTSLGIYHNMAIISVSERPTPEFAVRPTIVLRNVHKVAAQTVVLPEVVVRKDVQKPKAQDTANAGTQPTLSPRQQQLVDELKKLVARL